MRGRGIDGSPRRHLIISVCFTLVALSFVCVYYVSFKKSPFHQNGTSDMKTSGNAISRRSVKDIDVYEGKDNDGIPIKDDSMNLRRIMKDEHPNAQDSAFDIVSVKSFPVSFFPLPCMMLFCEEFCLYYGLRILIQSRCCALKYWFIC